MGAKAVNEGGKAMKHVVHSDNSEFFRKMMKSFLSEKGLESESFEKGEDAINAVKDGKVSFLITGMELADMTSEELIKRLTVLPVKPPVIVVTSTNDTTKNKRLKALGVKSIIRKSDNWKEELGLLIS